MLHPHTWVRFASAQVFGLVFSTYNPDELIAALLTTDQTSPDITVATVNKNTRYDMSYPTSRGVTLYMAMTIAIIMIGNVFVGGFF